MIEQIQEAEQLMSELNDGLDNDSVDVSLDLQKAVGRLAHMSNWMWHKIEQVRAAQSGWTDASNNDHSA